MFLLILLLLLYPFTAYGTTYYVAATGGNDSRSCTTAQTVGTPKLTIGNARGCLGPGDTLMVRSGTYGESLTNGGFPGGTSWNNPVTIQGYPGDAQPVWRPVGQDFIMYLGSPSEQYIIFKNLIFDVQGPQQGGGNIKVTGGTTTPGAHHIRFDHCTWKNGGYRDFASSDGPFSGYMSWSHTYGNEVLGGTVETSYYAIYLGTDAHDNLVDGLTVLETFGYGIHCYNTSGDSNNNIFRNNTILNSGTEGGSGSLPQCGILIACGDNNQVYNNIVSGARGGGICVGHASPASNTKVYNNTIVGNTLDHSAGFYGLYIPSGSGHVVTNNIVWHNTGGDYYGPSGTNNLINTDPVFVNESTRNYRLQPGSPAINAGANLSSTFTTDITGATRPASPGFWDIGAYEAEGSGGSPLIPSSGIFFMAQGGNNSTDCTAAKGTVAVPSAAPFGSYDIARQCMQAPWTLYMRGGTYGALDTQATPFLGGTSEATRSTITRYPGETVIIQGSGPHAGSGVAVYMRNSSTDTFITLKELIVESAENGIAVVNNSNILLDNVEVRNTWYEGVFASGTQHLTVQGGLLHDGGYGGSGLIGLDGTSDTTVVGVEIYNGADAGIKNFGGNSNLMVQRNTIRNNAAEGIAIGAGTGMKVQNNIIRQNTIGVHLLANEVTAQVAYNTIWGSSINCMVLEGGVSATVVDNICNQQASIINNAGASISFASNSCTGVAGCSTADPLFTSIIPGNPGFLHLAVGSPARDSGVVVPGLTQDITGKQRPTGTGVDKPDRGVYEEVYSAAGGGGTPPPALIQPGRTSMHLVP